MQTTNKIHSLIINQSSITTKLQEQFLLTRLDQGDFSVFWQLWQPHQNYLYSRCLGWMGGNHIDAEEALSLATLKAWQKLPNYAGKITNLRAWLTRFTHNLCVDIHRERYRKTIQIESLEEIAVKEEEEEAVISSFASPELALLNHELRQYINRAINTLPSRLRTPFILRYYQQISYQDIAQQLAISQNNVYKRIQQARDILQKRLRSYLSGLNDSVLDSSSDKSIECVAKSSPEDEAIASDFAQIETINYQVTAICLETVPRWYCSLSPLGWS